MADINPSVQSLINGLNNDKTRGTMDFTGSADLSSGQFLDMIASSISSFKDSDDNDTAPKADAASYSVNAKSSVKYSYNTAKSADTKNADKTSAAENASSVKPAVIDRSEIKEKIKAKLKEIAEKDDTPVSDTKALKALQKVANFLLKANSDGDISLPPAMVQKLQAFIAKGDDLKAADITQFMQDFNDAFKQMIVVMPNAPAAGTDATASADDQGLKWPSDVMDALKELGLQSSTMNPDKPLTIMDVLRTVKSLVNESEKAAIKTLDEKSKDIVQSQDQASILLAGSAAASAVAAPIAKTDNTQTTSSDPATAAIDTQIQANAAAPAADDAAVKKAIKDLQKGMEQAAAAQKPAAPAAKDPKADKPPAADAGKIVADPILNAINTVKSQPTVTNIDLSVPSTNNKPADKVEAPSLSKISLEAQAPNHNNDKSFSDSQRDNSRNQASTETVQNKPSNGANIAAAAATQSFSDIKADASAISSDTMTTSNITPAGLNAVTDGVKSAARVTQVANAQSSLPSAATQQVIAQIAQKADKATQISVNLTPAELGQVEIRLNIQKDGTVHTVVMVDKPETLALLQKDSAQLERSLQQAGLNADAKNMSFNLRDGNQAQQFNQGRKRFSRADIGSTVTEVAVNVAPEGQIITDNRVNYHA